MAAAASARAAVAAAGRAARQPRPARSRAPAGIHGEGLARIVSVGERVEWQIARTGLEAGTLKV